MAWNQLDSSPRWSAVATFILLILFSIGYSLNGNSSTVELPLLVQKLPEGWRLPAIVTFVSNLSYVGVLFVIFIRHITKSIAYEIPTNLFILTVGVLALFGIAFTWNIRTMINGTPHSVYFLTLTFAASICDVVSSVTFLPFFNRYRPVFMRALFIGDALSSLLPSWLALAQGVGKITCVPVTNQNGTKYIEQHLPEQFSPRIFYLILALSLFSGLVSLIILCWTRMEQLNNNSQSLETIDEQATITNNDSELELLNKNGEKTKHAISRKEFLVSKHGSYFLCILCNSFLINGCIPSLQSYALQPYSLEFYQKIVIAGQFCYPLMQIVSALLPQLTISAYPRLPYVCTSINVLLFSYIFFCAKLSPCSPFVESGWLGGSFVGLAWLLINSLGPLSNMLTNLHFRQNAGHRELFWSGLTLQTGTFLGSVIFFILTVNLKTFRERHVCQTYVC